MGHNAKPIDQRFIFNELMPGGIMTQPIESICVIGAGYMGNQIALQCAAHGFRVRIHDASEKSLQNSHAAPVRIPRQNDR